MRQFRLWECGGRGRIGIGSLTEEADGAGCAEDGGSKPEEDECREDEDGKSAAGGIRYSDAQAGEDRNAHEGEDWEGAEGDVERDECLRAHVSVSGHEMYVGAYRKHRPSAEVDEDVVNERSCDVVLKPSASALSGCYMAGICARATHRPNVSRTADALFSK